MIESKKKEIDGNTWMVSLFSATKGAKILAKIMRLLGGPFGKAIGGLSGGVGLLDAKIDFSIFGDAIGDLANRLDEDEVVDLIKQLMSSVRCDGKEVAPQFDLIFMGRYATMLKVAAYVIQENYKLPFFDYLDNLKGSQEKLASIQGLS